MTNSAQKVSKLYTFLETKNSETDAKKTDLTFDENIFLKTSKVTKFSQKSVKIV